jgi:hypothetical protein
MVTIALNTRSTVPTIRSLKASSITGTDFTHQTTTWESKDTQVLAAGETFFCSLRIRSGSNSSSSYGQIQVLNGAGTQLKYLARYQSSHSTTHFEYKNETGSSETLTLQIRVDDTGSYASGTWTRGLVMNDTDLAKWERVNLPTTRHRKYAADKYYLLAKWTSGSLSVDGYSVENSYGGIIEVPVETIVSSTELAGSGAHFFQITGKGFTATS